VIESQPVAGSAPNVRAQIDPDVVKVIDEMSGWDLPEHDLVLASRLSAEREVRFGGVAADVAEIGDATVETAAGVVAVRWYRPHGPRGRGALLWIHGGGWICGTLDTCEPVARALAAASGLTVVCPDYALSPEVAAPVAVEQCLGTADALRRGAIARVGEAPALAVGGDSAGGNLAAGVALLARDRGGPTIDLQLLCEPTLHPRWRSASREAFATGTTVTAEGLEKMWDLYLQGADPSPHAAPLSAHDVAGLPPAIVVAAACDPLRDEARAYAARLVDAGIGVSYDEHTGLAHGMFTYFGVVAAARQVVERTGRAVRERLLGSPGARHPA
jgi:acetyl esterase